MTAQKEMRNKFLENEVTDEWIKMWFVYTMEYHLAVRKNEILPFVAMWMELEGIMLSAICQSEKDRYHMFSLICGS